MAIQDVFFGPQQEKVATTKHVSAVEIPARYRATVRWAPRIGDIFPNFQARTTHGPIDYHTYAEGHWTHVFSHPRVGDPVTATELASLASLAPDFAERNVRHLCISTAALSQQEQFTRCIEKTFDCTLDFPFVEDESGELSESFGMSHERDDVRRLVRKSFIVDPALKLRMIFTYPKTIGRSMEEILRVIDAERLVSRQRLATPADWYPGQPALVPRFVDDNEAESRWGRDMKRVNHYLRVVPTKGL